MYDTRYRWCVAVSLSVSSTLRIKAKPIHRVVDKLGRYQTSWIYSTWRHISSKRDETPPNWGMLKINCRESWTTNQMWPAQSCFLLCSICEVFSNYKILISVVSSRYSYFKSYCRHTAGNWKISKISAFISQTRHIGDIDIGEKMILVRL